MKKYNFLFLVVLSLIISASLSFAQTSENVTITTYYPAPYGEYRQVKLTPTTGFTPFSSCSSNGTMLFDNTTQNVYVCKGSPATWQPLGVTVSDTYTASVSSVTSNCGGGCTKETSMGSIWRYCALTQFDHRFWDNTEDHRHDRNQCRIYKSGVNWILRAHYNINGSSGDRVGYTTCNAQCFY